MATSPAHQDTRIDVDMQDLIMTTGALTNAEVGRLVTKTFQRIHEGDCEDLPRWVVGYRHIKGNLRSLRVARADGSASSADRKARHDFYGGICWICRTAPATCMDHVKPLAAGGSNWPANLRPACQPCNSRKGAKWPFIREAA